MKRILLKYGRIGLLLFVLYVVFGIIFSYCRHPDVSEEYRTQYQKMKFTSDTVSCDRACIIEDNVQALKERLRMIGEAQERIILSTFEFRADESGKDIIAALIQAAERGVKIRIVVDGTFAFLRMDGNPYFNALASMEQVEIRAYNRINLLTPWKSMGRLHDKYLIVDEDLYLLGGRNTYDYFLGDNGYKNYDRDVLVYNTEPGNKDSSIYQVEAYFDSVWNLDVCKDLRIKGKDSEAELAKAREELEARYRSNLEEYGLKGKLPDYASMTYETDKITLLSNPTHVYAKEPTVFYALTELMKEADGEIKIHTPYVICNSWMYDCLEEICADNDRVSMLTNSAANNGNPFGASDYLLHKKRLLSTGITICEYEGGVSYHGKSIAIGDELSVVGSFNIDMRSAYLDTELMLVIDSREVNRQLTGYLDAYEREAARTVDAKNYEVPEGVTRQKMGAKKAVRAVALGLFNWLRFLM